MSKPNTPEFVDTTILFLQDFGVFVSEEDKELLLSFPTIDKVECWKMKRIREAWEAYEDD